MNKKILLFALMSIALFVVGCGAETAEKETQTTTSSAKEYVIVDAESDGEDIEDTSAETEEATLVAIAIQDYAYDNDNLRIKRGTTVVWTNEDSAPHTVTGEGFNSDKLEQGESWAYTFTKPGLYDYHCKYHPSMKGNIMVE